MDAIINDFVSSGLKTFKTGGTSDNTKSIDKTFENLEAECRDIFEALNIPQELIFTTTTTPEHLFGFTFYLMFPYFHNYKRKPQRVNYPEDINTENAVLITTPSFLEAMQKYDVKPAVNPKIIITAGAELKPDVFKYAQSISERVIEIYGSTETGVIGYREKPTSKFKKFKGIEILETNDDFTMLKTQYSKEALVKIEDKIEYKGGRISFLGRTGRVLKVLEKRISADSMEKEIKKSSFVKDCFCFEYARKIAVLVVLENNGINFAIKFGTQKLTKLLKNELCKKFEIVPSKWRYWDEIPRNIKGKIDKDAIEELFKTNLSLPLMTSGFVDGNVALYEMCFLRDSNFFKGHFDNLPILAGVVQLYYANFFAKRAFGIDCRGGQIRRIKFTNIIRPDKRIHLYLKHTDKGVVYKFEQTEDFTYSSGLLPLENILKKS